MTTQGCTLTSQKQKGWKQIDCIVLDCDETQAELWEIAENLHRAELSVIERAEQIARWVELSAVFSAQLGQKVKGRPESGTSQAARELGISEPEARRAVKVCKITGEAKDAAAKAGLCCKAGLLCSPSLLCRRNAKQSFFKPL